MKMCVGLCALLALQASSEINTVLIPMPNQVKLRVSLRVLYCVVDTRVSKGRDVPLSFSRDKKNPLSR